MSMEGLPEAKAGLPRLVHVTDSTAPLPDRVRSYFAVNCAYCHHPGSAVRATWDAQNATALLDKRLINHPPLNDIFRDDSKLVSPGSVADSVLFRRVSELGVHHMPPLATSLPDEAAIAMLEEWIMGDLPQPIRLKNARTTEGGAITFQVYGYSAEQAILDYSADLKKQLL